MGLIVQIADFEVAPNAINSNSYQENDLNGFIDLLEKSYLVKILGSELADLYIADLDGSGIPQNAPFIVLNNPLDVLYFQRYVHSPGIKSIIKGFIRAEWIKSLQLRQSPTGSSITKKENSNQVTGAYFSGYNECVVQATAVQTYIKQNRADYPTFKGQILETINPLW